MSTPGDGKWEAYAAEQRALFAAHPDRLTERETCVWALRYGENSGRTLWEIAEELRISGERVRQLLNRSEQRLLMPSPSPPGELTAGSRVDDLALSVRSVNALKNVGIHTVGALVAHACVDAWLIMRIKNLGAKSLYEIGEAIQPYVTKQLAILRPPPVVDEDE